MSRTARKRDAQKSRRKIVLAARAEFAAKGYAGARMEQIADRAEVKKELIYHYFRGKEHLFEEVRAEQLADVEQHHEIPHNPLLDDSHSAAEMFAWRFRRMLGDVEWVKLLTWEAVQTEVAPPPNEEARRATIKDAVDLVKEAQRHGRIPADLNPQLLQLAIFALATYPLAFSQITQMTTGLSALDKRFQSAWTSFLRKLGERVLSTEPAAALKKDDSQLRRHGKIRRAAAAARPRLEKCRRS
jgi:TetR/AcrR family transcriptional regulator